MNVKMQGPKHKYTVRIPATNDAVCVYTNGSFTRINLTDEMCVWLDQNHCDPRIQYYKNYVVFEFDNDHDSMLFSLRWL